MARFEVIGGGWLAKTKKGDEYVRIAFLREAKFTTGDILVMYHNDGKVEGTKAPDYRLYVPAK